jgi:tagatose-6-phosphate ketose/aldose isomerase
MNFTTSLFGMDDAALEDAGAEHTAREIAQQASAWIEVRRQIDRERVALERFLEPLLAQSELRIILTGAGSSAFIGEALAPTISRALNRRVESIATTEIVAAPRLYLQTRVPTLLVSFARSGNSPESIATATLVDHLVAQHAHLVITCNRDGELCQSLRGREDAYVMTLPEMTHDRGFAMTSSFSSMLLAAAMVFGVVPELPATGLATPEQVKSHLARASELARELVALGAKRVVFLGSSVLKAIAREAALKLLELTDGRIVATAESSLGFRHGPKTILNSSTIVFMLISNDSYTRKYDLDLLRELRTDNTAARVVAVTGRVDGVSAQPDHFLFEDMHEASDLELALPMLVFAQTFALLESLALAVRPDNPSAAGTVSRVVRGVTIHSLA